MGWLAYALFTNETHEDWLSFFDAHGILALCVLTVTGLYWGKRHTETKCLMMLELSPRLKRYGVLGESLGLWCFSVIFLFMGFCLLWLAYFVADWPALKREESRLAWEERADRIHVEFDGRRDVGITMFFAEGEMLSPVTYHHLSVQRSSGSEQVLFKSMREFFMDQTTSFSLPKQVTNRAGFQLRVMIKDLREMSSRGSWTLSLWLWFFEWAWRLFVLSLVLSVLGKHISLELGMVVLLTYLFVDFSFSLYSDGDYERIMNRLALDRPTKSRFQELWWQGWLSHWSVLTQEYFRSWQSSQEGARSFLLKGFEWNLNGRWFLLGWWMFLFAGLSTLLDRVLVRFRPH